jgi:hypothetical protein
MAMAGKTLALTVFAAMTATAFIATPSTAAPKQQAGYELAQYSAQTRRNMRVTSRPRGRITVTPRSYLDAGTEVYPGSQSYSDYVMPLGYSAFKNFDPTGASRHPLPDAFEMRSYHTPGGGY